MIIKDSYVDWNSNPILTTTEEIGASLTEVEFPTTTICHEPKYQVDNWVLPELILNFMSFNCWKKKGPKCEYTVDLRNDFKALLDFVYNNISSSLEMSQIDVIKLNDNFYGSSKNYNLYGKHLWKWLASNSTTNEEIEEILKASIGKYGTQYTKVMLQVAYLRMYLAKVLPKPSIMAKCKENCNELYSKMSRILLKAVALNTGHLTLERYTDILHLTLELLTEHKTL